MAVLPMKWIHSLTGCLRRLKTDSSNNNTTQHTISMANPTIQFAIKATIKSVYPVQNVTPKFRKNINIVSDQFGNDLAFEATYEIADGMASFAPGTPVDINFALNSNPMKTDPSRWFTSAVITSISPQAAQAVTQAPQPVVAAPQPVAAVAAPAPAAAPPAGESIPF
jgi:hypothetical protein